MYDYAMPGNGGVALHHAAPGAVAVTPVPATPRSRPRRRTGEARMPDSKAILDALTKAHEGKIQADAKARSKRETQWAAAANQWRTLSEAWHAIYQPAKRPDHPDYWRNWHAGIMDFCRVVKSLG